MVIPLTSAQELLRPIQGFLHEIVISAWNDYHNDNYYSPEVRCRHTSRSRANLVWDNMVYHAKRLLTSVKGVRIREDGDIFLIYYKEKVSLRFKKFDDGKRPSNVQTEQTISFLAQEELPHMPAHASRLITGYQLSALQDAIQSVMIICPNGSRNEWEWTLEGPAIAQIFSMPIKPIPSTPQPTSQIRIRVKKQRPELKIVEKGNDE